VIRVTISLRDAQIWTGDFDTPPAIGDKIELREDNDSITLYTVVDRRWTTWALHSGNLCRGGTAHLQVEEFPWPEEAFTPGDKPRVLVDSRGNFWRLNPDSTVEFGPVMAHSGKVFQWHLVSIQDFQQAIAVLGPMREAEDQ
jgi:hypothetical protein